MQKKIDLVNGPVLSSLTRLAIPIMATSLIQMAYNMTDMIWIGRIGSSAVASVGAAGMYIDVYKRQVGNFRINFRNTVKSDFIPVISRKLIRRNMDHVVRTAWYAVSYPDHD